MTLVFDIETGPLPDEVLAELFTFDESKVPGFALLSQEFDPQAVKTGNLKDPEKIKAKMEQAKEEFSLKKRAAEIALEEGRADAWQAFMDKAALSPLTGQVLAVGIWDANAEQGKEMIVSCVDDFFSEQELIEAMLGLLESRILSGQKTSAIIASPSTFRFCCVAACFTASRRRLPWRTNWTPTDRNTSLTRYDIGNSAIAANNP